MKPGDRVRWHNYRGTLIETRIFLPRGMDAKVDWDDVPGKPSPWVRAEELSLERSGA